jgi:hypothetical protein
LAAARYGAAQSGAGILLLGPSFGIEMGVAIVAYGTIPESVTLALGVAAWLGRGASKPERKPAAQAA